jgi:hypothetical protein
MRHLVVLALVLGVAGWAAAAGSARATSCAPNTGVTATGSGITIVNGVVTIPFTVAAGCTNVQLSLVSYSAPSATFDENTAADQVRYQETTQVFSANGQLSIAIPSCYYQVDLVYGTPIEQLGPAGTNNFYGKQGRLIANLHGGTTKCEAPQPPPAEEATVTICHATGTPDNGANGYVSISPSVSGVLNGHLSQHEADIIPPFTVNGVTYSQHWDAAGQAIYNNGCVVPASAAPNQPPSNNNNNAAVVTPTPPPPPVAPPSITLTKLERVGSSGSFTTGPVTANVGDVVNYQLVVTNTGATDESVNLSDTGCSSLTPTGPQAITAGASLTFTCSHQITAADGSSYTNTAIVTANNAGPAQASAQSSVVANVGVVSVAATTGNTAGGVLGAQKTLKHKAVKKHKVVKKVTHKAKAAKAAVAAARVTG